MAYKHLSRRQHVGTAVEHSSTLKYRADECLTIGEILHRFPVGHDYGCVLKLIQCYTVGEMMDIGRATLFAVVIHQQHIDMEPLFMNLWGEAMRALYVESLQPKTKNKLGG
ncbi:MAG TPA: hypothetical protein VNQ55_02410 [Parapedobacter sp.]|nr:hypothetical protein [Parapedobacter sp.]